MHNLRRAALSSLADSFFAQATVYEKIHVGIDAMSLALGIVLVPLALVALARAGGHRPPFAALLVGMLCYVASHALEIAYTILIYNRGAFEHRHLIMVALSAADSILISLTDVCSLLAVVLLLWDRQSSLAPDRPSMLKRLIDIVLIAAMVVLAAAPHIVIGITHAQRIHRQLSRETVLKRAKIFTELIGAFIVVYFVVAVNIVVTAALHRIRVLRLGTKHRDADKPANVVLFVLAPLMLAHWAFFLFQEAWSAARTKKRPATADSIVIDVATAESMVLPACIALILIALGIRRATWNTFGGDKHSHAV